MQGSLIRTVNLKKEKLFMHGSLIRIVNLQKEKLCIEAL
jgi:hypothetical protein